MAHTNGRLTNDEHEERILTETPPNTKQPLLNKFVLYESKTKFYVVASNINDSRHRMLKTYSRAGQAKALLWDRWCAVFSFSLYAYVNYKCIYVVCRG
jgi:hypothetical protein